MVGLRPGEVKLPCRASHSNVEAEFLLFSLGNRTRKEALNFYSADGRVAVLQTQLIELAELSKNGAVSRCVSGLMSAKARNRCSLKI
jgi:hypothetical protein